MSANTAIEWTDHTFNPWIGCTKVSPGCDNCYAARQDKFRHWTPEGWGGPRKRTKTWGEPVKWNAQHDAFFAQHGRRQRVFCASLADVFDNQAPEEWRADLFALIRATPNLDWLLLTKRIGNVRNMLPAPFDFDRHYPNVWLGATVVNQDEADRDIPKLLAVPARVRFLSIEPMLGPIDLRHLNDGRETNEIDALKPWTWEQEVEAWRGTAPEWEDDFEDWFGNKPAGLTGPMHQRIDWVICGGESGPNARPMHPDWARSLRDQCAAAGVPFLFKQWGEWLAISQQTEDFTNRLYRSNRTAKLHEDQGAIDESYGRRCVVPCAVIHSDGSVHELMQPMAFLQGTGAMQNFRVGKKAAGRLLDGVQHDGFPMLGIEAAAAQPTQA